MAEKSVGPFGPDPFFGPFPCLHAACFAAVGGKPQYRAAPCGRISRSRRNFLEEWPPAGLVWKERQRNGGHGRRSRGANSLDCDAGFGVQRLNWGHCSRNWTATGEIGKQRAGSPIVHAARHKETGGLFPKYGQDDPAGPLPDEAFPFQPCPVKFAVRGHSPISMSRTSEPSTTNRKAVRTLWMP